MHYGVYGLLIFVVNHGNAFVKFYTAKLLRKVFNKHDFLTRLLISLRLNQDFWHKLGQFPEIICNVSQVVGVILVE